MKTTVSLPDDLFRQADAAARRAIQRNSILDCSERNGNHGPSSSH